MRHIAHHMEALLAVAALVATAASATAQGIVVDQGSFAVLIDGRDAGTETFTLRRAGLGRDDAVFANGVISLRREGQTQEIRPLLRARPSEGTSESYQVSVTGPHPVEARLARSGRRFVATIRSEAGAEDREFQARAGTRILELDVAHHYYFLRDVREGAEIHTIEPRTRRQVTLTAGPRADVEIVLGPNTVSARRVTFAGDEDDERTVWFDRQGRVLRVEIPSSGYAAERTDLVG